MTSQFLVFASAFGAMLVSTFLRGFQNKNVAGGHKRLAFVCGMFMTAAEGFVVLLLAGSGHNVILFTSLGAGVGWVGGMYAHERLLRRQRKAAKARKRAKRDARIKQIVAQQLEKS